MINQLQQLLQQHVADTANEIDNDKDQLSNAYQLLADHHLLALSVDEARPPEQVLSAQEKFYGQKLIAQYSGALAFLSAQQELAAYLISLCEKKELLNQYLRVLANGEIRFGNAVSQLRDRHLQKITLTKTNNTYQLNGSIKWLTGFGLLDKFILGLATDQHEYYIVLPFTPQSGANGDILFSTPMTVATMQSTQTVSCELNNWTVTENDILIVKPVGYWQLLMRNTVSMLPRYAGIAQAAINFIHQADPDFSQSLNQRLNDLEKHMIEMPDQLESGAKRALFSHYANTCVYLAKHFSRGSALQPHHIVNRLNNELLQFNALAQTDNYSNALKQLIIDNHCG